MYLVNLLVADLMLTLALPFKILKDLGMAPWSLMVFHCQASAVTIYISLYASISFLALIIMDRYMQVGLRPSASWEQYLSLRPMSKLSLRCCIDIMSDRREDALFIRF